MENKFIAKIKCLSYTIMRLLWHDCVFLFSRKALLLALRLKHSQSNQGTFQENFNFGKAKT